ncbi:MAG: sulfite exporter TauE/SafE family protein [Neptuniibacter sp.]
MGLTGVGGGALMAPILLFGFGFDLATVIATDLLFAAITKIFAGGIHSRNKLVDWQVTKRLWVGSIPACIFIVILAQSGLLFESPEWLVKILGSLIIFSGLAMLFGRRIQSVQRIRRISSPKYFVSLQRPATITGGCMLGSLVTATSIGAGALGAITLRALYPLRMTAPKLIATDTVHAIPVSLLGGVSYLMLGYTDLTLLGLLIIGSIPAAIVAGQLANKMPSHHIKMILGLALIIAGLKLTFS